MPKLSAAFTTREITLPSFQDSKVVVYSTVETGVITEANKLEGDMDKSLFIAAKLIQSWNFDTEEGKPLEITVENLKKLPYTDMAYLIEEVIKPLQKKKVDLDKTPSSTPSKVEAPSL